MYAVFHFDTNGLSHVWTFEMLSAIRVAIEFL